MTKTVVEVVYGKYSKYEIIKETGVLSTDIRLYKDGKYVSTHKSVEDAVKYAREKG